MKSLPLATLALALTTALQSHAAPVDLRGYGKVDAAITPQRSEFTCESDAKADIVLGKLLADMFWDAGSAASEKTVHAGGRDILIHEWQPYGDVVVGRNKNHVVVVGGTDAQTAADLAAKEPLLASADAVFTQQSPYPKFLDAYDLRAVNCYTLGLHFENKFRYKERTAFENEFFKGGLFNTGNAFFMRTPADRINPFYSTLDTDIRLAEKNDQMYSIAISTGGWPLWAWNKWPDFVDRESQIHSVNADPFVWCPPESLGMSEAQRRDSSLGFLRDVMTRYKDSKTIGAWQLYCGDYVCESFFWRNYQGHLGYTPSGLDSFRQWLKQNRSFTLAALGNRWFGDPGHFKKWTDVTPPDPDQFYGNFNSSCINIHDAWSWIQTGTNQIERPADNNSGWKPVPMPPSQQIYALPAGPSFWRATFDATTWLHNNSGKDIYLVFNVNNEGWRKTNVWLNDNCLGAFQSKASTFGGPFGLKVTGLVTPGANKVYFQVAGGGNPIGPIFLTTTQPRIYPYFGKYANAQYVDALQWRYDALNSKEINAMAYARSIDPDRPLVVCATDIEVKDPQGMAIREYGGSMQDTGYEASYRPFNSRLGYAAGFYGSCEQAGNTSPKESANYPTYAGVTMTRRLGWTLFNGEGMYCELRDPYIWEDVEQKTGWFTKNKRTYDLLGKYLPEKPDIAIFHSSLSALVGDDFNSANWDIGRGELHSSHYDNVNVTESMIEQGLANDYPVLFDTDSLFVEQSTIDAIRKYVEQGGTFIALQDTGRHALLQPDTWPISQLTGFKVLETAKKGRITFEKNLPIFKGWEGKQFEGEGSSLDWKNSQSATDVSIGLAPTAAGTVALARWDDGSVAVGMRTLGKGRVIILGSTFWRNGRDLGGHGTWRAAAVEPVFLERLFTDLGVKRNADASTPEVYARKGITKNGLQDWLIAMNTTGAAETTDLRMAVETHPDTVWDMVTNQPAPFTYADGWITLKNTPVDPYGTRVFGVKRGLLSEGTAFWWNEKTRFWTRRAEVPPLANPPAVAAGSATTLSFDKWKFTPDQNGSIASAAQWLQPAFDDGAWRNADNTPWNLQFDDLKDYGGIGLYRSLPFALPPNWNGKPVTVNISGMLAACWSSLEVYVNGRKLDQFLHPYIKVDISADLQKTGNVVCIKLTGKPPGGDYPLSGLSGAMLYLEREPALAPSISLSGTWQAASSDWSTLKPITVSDIDLKLTADGRMKPGVTALTANHLVRDFDIPSSWKGKSVYLHIVSPQMRGHTPPVTGLTGGAITINGRMRTLDVRPNIPLDEMVNLTSDIKYGQSNRLELWTRDTSKGSMTDDNIVINNIEIGGVTH